MIPRRGVWWATIVAAHHASWRLVLMIFVITVVPAFVMCALTEVVFGAAAARSVAFMFGLFAVSPFIHEFSHAAAHVLLSRNEQAVVAGVGDWSSGQIVRWQIAPKADAFIAVIGPFTATVSGLISGMLLPIPFVIGYPITVLFGLHILSLRPSAADGRDLWNLLTKERHA